MLLIRLQTLTEFRSVTCVVTVHLSPMQTVVVDFFRKEKETRVVDTTVQTLTELPTEFRTLTCVVTVDLSYFRKQTCVGGGTEFRLCSVTFVGTTVCSLTVHFPHRAASRKSNPPPPLPYRIPQSHP